MAAEGRHYGRAGSKPHSGTTVTFLSVAEFGIRHSILNGVLPTFLN
jgi:hypothetical protein